ncbi:MAG: bifunctional folylpolyglutamate synthase/dihydrofolate synthase [Candidatus Koribacter versatilis]|uniref:Dihydrofolate synthase/folylpolyglutamate synthase n=1 Tax=Candidatus Korobacter versatilis TaxID=658062 RepID=A0A932A7H1_9BACT|nr:bifunctional folylpolyglutamate synthase/dihydrofolate synthase [Candidatus Koribacter versatilis]
MTYDVAVEKLLALGHELHLTPAAKFDLDHMRVLLAALGNPERRFASVLIAGTNGKGSTAATLASILSAAGFRTGLYTSPHLVRINERIAINGEEISEPEFAEIHQRVDDASQQLVREKKLPWHPSFFETLTAMAFEYFASAGAEIAVLEVGMGGRLDATNVSEPLLSVITDVALDHQKFLGNTIAEIAREKAGIIRANGVLVTLPQHPEANDVIGRVAQERNARGVSAVPYMPPVSPGSEWPVAGGQWSERQVLPPTGHQPPATGYPLQVLGETMTVDSPLRGRHQLRNLALAIAAAVELNQFGFKVTPEHIARGIRETRWPGRLQLIERDGQQYLLDVAHNPAGAWALRSALSTYFDGRPLVFVFAALRDKNIAEMADILFPLAERIVATTVQNPRAASPEEIALTAARTGAEIVCRPAPAEALRTAKELAGCKALVVVTGSIYLVGEALQAFGAPR